MKKFTIFIVSALLMLGVSACSPAPGNTPERIESSSAENSEAIVGGVISDASMNAVTINTNEGETFQFGTEDADKSLCSGIEIGTAVWVTYTGEEESGAAAVKMIQTEELSVAGTVGDGTSMNVLELVLEDGDSESFPLMGVDMSGVSGLTVGNPVRVFYAEYTAAPAAYQRVITRVVDNTGAEQEISGTIVDASMNTLVIQTAEEQELAFGTEDADKSKCSGLEIGSKVTVFYTGTIDGTDTSGVTVLRLEQAS